MTVALLRRCPACGIFISRTSGCDHMMCGAAAHSEVDAALRMGGCAHEFLLSSLAPTNNGSPGNPHNERQILFGKYTGPPIAAKYDKANQAQAQLREAAEQQQRLKALAQEEAKAAKDAAKVALRPPPKQGSTFSGASVAVRR